MVISSSCAHAAKQGQRNILVATKSVWKMHATLFNKIERRVSAKQEVQTVCVIVFACLGNNMKYLPHSLCRLHPFDYSSQHYSICSITTLFSPLLTYLSWKCLLLIKMNAFSTVFIAVKLPAHRCNCLVLSVLSIDASVTHVNHT